ncbi:pseudouridylate synthase 1 homolog [Neocloeon triangulifer]|uniref:pseudouridylate synthase 1 homolog n=1 Tax=Neocloeon triangulifer TaxID=2078957 RepID=UPI00286EE927|nr:pseudouridylate synthase 1 homolog [Neocloeon triangulifer]
MAISSVVLSRSFFVRHGRRFLCSAASKAAAITLEGADECLESPKFDAKYRRKKVALLMGYSGEGFHGMQRNMDMRTIEGEFFKALHKADLAREEECNEPWKIKFQRASRTDKNVSAAKQVVSLSLCTDPGEVLAQLNTHLPPEIRIFGLRRATNTFDSQKNCDARTYSYTFPSFALSPVGCEDESFRVTPEMLDKFSKTLKLYKGFHNFHNFTCDKHFVDPSSNRFIISFECFEPFGADGMEFIECQVKGNSFMMHQIRRMVAVAISVVKGMVEPEIINKAYTELRLNLPMAPGLGLILQEVHYDKYNKTVKKLGFHEPLTWEAEEEAVAKFKKDFILPTIIDGEKNGKSMLNWITTLAMHTFEEKVNFEPEKSNQS